MIRCGCDWRWPHRRTWCRPDILVWHVVWTSWRCSRSTEARHTPDSLPRWAELSTYSSSMSPSTEGVRKYPLFISTTEQKPLKRALNRQMLIMTLVPSVILTVIQMLQSTIQSKRNFSNKCDNSQKLRQKIRKSTQQQTIWNITRNITYDGYRCNQFWQLCCGSFTLMEFNVNGKKAKH